MAFPPSLDFSRIPEMRYAAVEELNFGDQWRARFMRAQKLPPGARATHVYALAFLGDRGYLGRQRDTETWSAIDGAVEAGETGPAAAKRLARDRMGLVAGKVIMVGFLEAIATRHNRNYKTGEAVYRPVYIVAGKSVKDIPASSNYERRRLPLNEYAVAVRRLHSEVDVGFSHAIDQYLLLRSKGEI